jgi:hypothetical protein
MSKHFPPPKHAGGTSFEIRFVEEKSVEPVTSHANARSFDSARLAPRAAQDDKN